jgi:hypothetical protein
MRTSEFISEKDKLDEVLPLITGAAALAGGAMSLAGGVASGVGAAAKGIGKGIGGVASGVGGVASGVGSATKGVGKGAGNLASKIGAPDNKPKDPAKRLAMDRVKDQAIRPGSQIDLATPGPGGTEKFKVRNMQGDNVEIENPNPAPGEPKTVTYKKDDVKRSMSL